MNSRVVHVGISPPGHVFGVSNNQTLSWELLNVCSAQERTQSHGTHTEPWCCVPWYVLCGQLVTGSCACACCSGVGLGNFYIIIVIAVPVLLRFGVSPWVCSPALPNPLRWTKVTATIADTCKSGLPSECPPIMDLCMFDSGASSARSTHHNC